MRKAFQPETKYYCPICQKELTKENLKKSSWHRVSKGLLTFCGQACKGKNSSKRMLEKNPMRLPEAVEKMKATLKKIGHKPNIQGGNGKGMSVPQKMVLEKLPEGWYPELIIPTRNGYQPHHYKIDIANPTLQVAIEIDGGSHTRKKIQAADQRKTMFLNGLGWKVLRFTNNQVLDNLEMVLSIILK
jgi:hypothetical protein